MPDGFLLKLKYVGEITLSEALQNLKLERSEWSLYGGKYKFSKQNHEDTEVIHIVEGEIEVVEVKSDKSFTPPNQIESYSNVLKKGYKLRYFHVFMISFVKNQFEIEEKVLTDKNELRRTMTYFRKRARMRA